MQKLRNKFFLWIFLWPLLMSAQESLSLEDAVAIALKNNYGILIANSQVEMDSINATKGNAGYWPSIGFEAGADYGNTFLSKQKFSSGSEQNETFAQTWGASTAVQMDWTIFDGKRMFATLDKLKALTDKSRASLRADLETLVANVNDSYYEVIYQQDLISIIEQNLALYKERETLAKRRWEIGTTSKLDYLQANLDLKEQQSKIFQMQVDLDDAKAALNNLLSRSPETTFIATDTMTRPELPTWSEIVEKATNNMDLATMKYNIGIGETIVKEAEAAKKPVISWSNRLGYGYNQNQAGFLQKSQQAQFSSGLALHWNIFNGKSVHRNIQYSKLQVQQYKMQYDNNKEYVQLLAYQSLNRLRNALDQLSFEEESTDVAEEAIKVAAERYRVGNGTSLELKEIQRSYIDLKARIATALFAARSAETGLLHTIGALIPK